MAHIDQIPEAAIERLWRAHSRDLVGLATMDIVAAAPDVADHPTVATITPTCDGAPRRLLPAAAAALIVTAGVTGIALANRGNPSQTGTPAAEQPVGPALTAPHPEPTAPVTTPDLDQPCSDGTGETTVPNVAGMPDEVAIDTLNAAGLGSEVVLEASTHGEPAVYGYVVARQDPTPGDTLACGDVIVLTVADLPTANYALQPGDTWESIAAAMGMPVEDLLHANELTLATLEATGETVATPLDPGRVITLILAPTLDTAPPTTA